ncbi:MAG TPA: hypothetical protein VKE96_30255 [Vicinamibacterales bacterium]|nr:hypothetical protein [Vicinamibacterales bacterium]
MSKRSIVFTTLAAVAIIAATTLAAAAGRAPVQASRITFTEVTRVCGHYLAGDYIVVHDDNKMAAGEPCTTFYRMRKGKPAVAEVSFRCSPKQRAPVAQTTIWTVPTVGVTSATQSLDLVEFQLAGDPEAHVVPPFDTLAAAR